MMPIELIIFDNDGVLIDSEIIWHEQCVDYFSKKGIAVSIDDSVQFFTFKQQNRLSAIIKNEDIIHIRNLTESSYPRLLKPVHGIKHVLKQLTQQDRSICVASNADLTYITQTITLTKLSAYIKENQLFSCDLVSKLKPAPDLLLYIADFFNIRPQSCLVIEDHALGVQAAHLAKMPVWGFLGGKHANSPGYLSWLKKSLPDKIITNSTELLKTLNPL